MIINCINNISYVILMSEGELVNPFITGEHATIVPLHCHQIDSNYYLHLKKNLEKKIVGKCNNIGLYTKIVKLTDYEQNEINIENFTADAEYSVKFIATMCIPMPNTMCILKFKKAIFEFGNYLINADNGALSCVMAVKKNGHYISMKEGKIYIDSQDRFLEIGDYIKVEILNKKIDPGDKKIGIIGKIVSLATEEEVKEFYYDKVLVDEQEIEQEIVHFNEDIEEDNNPIETSKGVYTDI